MKKNIYIVRHGEAVHQVNSDVWGTYTDERMPLSALGIRQAKECGQFFKALDLPPEKTLLITSPYTRAAETADKIQEITLTGGVLSESLLVEQNFGLFTGLSTEQCYATYPVLAKKYDMQEHLIGAYRVKAPEGESKEDVVLRTEKFAKKLTKILDKSPYENVIIVAHCVVDRALIKTLNCASEEWFLAQDRLKNCAIRQFSYDGKSYQDLGFVFTPKEKSKSITIASNLPLVKKEGNEL